MDATASLSKAAADLSLLLDHAQADVRQGSAASALALTGSASGLRLLRGAGVHLALARLVIVARDEDDEAPAAPPGGECASGLALKALVNMTAEGGDEGTASGGAPGEGEGGGGNPGGGVGAVVRALLALRPALVAGLLARLRDKERACRGAAVLLLVNLTRSSGNGGVSGASGGGECDGDEGCRQLLEDGGHGVRRLVQLLLMPVARPRPGDSDGVVDSGDEFAHAASVLANVTRLAAARDVLLSPERRLLPALLPQLALAASPHSTARRRGVAQALRNCCFGADAARVEFLLSPSVDFVTAVLLPLAGASALYRPQEREALPPRLAELDESKVREPDALTRLAIVESLRILAGLSRAARDHMRAFKTYAVVRAFHEWLETDAQQSEGDEPLPPDDEAAVAAINVLMQQLWRDDEVPAPPPGPMRLEKPRPRRGGPASLSEREEVLTIAPSVGLETAQGIARRIAHNLGVTDEEVALWNSQASVTATVAGAVGGVGSEDSEFLGQPR